MRQFGENGWVERGWLVATAVAVPAGDGHREGQHVPSGRSGEGFDGGQVVGVGRVREAIGDREVAEGGEGGAQMVQHGAAADQQVRVVGVGGRQAAVGVDVEVHRAGVEVEAPGLGVVDRRGPDRELEGGAEDDRAWGHNRRQVRCG